MSLASAALSSCLVPSNRSGFSQKSVGVVPLSVGTVPLNIKIVAQQGDLFAKREVCLQAEKASSLASAPTVEREVKKSLLPLPSSFISRYGDTEPRKGADIIVEALEREGIEHVFAYPGGASIEIHQALTRSKVIKNILCRHEQGEIFAAEGYARSTGKVGVCIATSGPGATNLVSGLADALLDSIPLVAITGQVPRRMIGTDAFQETPIVEVTRSITKRNYLIMDVEEIPRVLREAFFLAASGRPGPVLVDIPKDVQQQMAIPNWTMPIKLNSYIQRLPKSPQIPQLEQILRLIFNSKKPVLYVGGGCLNASQELREFVDYTGIPVTTTLMGLGSFPSSDERSLEMLGMHGTVYANYAVDKADLLLAFGVRFDDRVTGKLEAFASHASIVHIDIDPAEIGKNKQPHISMCADVQLALQGLNDLMKNREDRPDFQLWREELKEQKTKWPMKYVKFEHAISPQHAIQLVHELTKGNAIIATGVGQHQMWAAQWFKYDRPRQWLTSGGLGAMGFGLPAALGAVVGNPGTTVVDIDGDGSFLMNVQELATIKVENLPVKIMILNNQHLGMVVQWEDRFYKANRAHTYLGDPSQETQIFPDFLKMAESCKIPAARVTNKADLRAAISQMLETPGPYLLDVIVPHQEHVLPMIPAGGGFKDIITEDERSLEMLGMHVTVYANYAVDKADLLLAFGVRFDDRITWKLEAFANRASIVHIDIDPAEIGKNKQLHLSMCAEVQLAQQGLNDLMKNREDMPDFQFWREELKEQKTKWSMKYVKFEDAISPQHAIQLVHELTKGDAIIATGVGQHQMWAAQWFKYDRPRQWLTSGGLGAMGFGLPAALGAVVGNPG